MVCTYACMHVYMYVFMFGMCVWFELYVCMNVRTYACIYVYMHVCMVVCMYVCMYVCIYCVYGVYVWYLCMYFCLYVCIYGINVRMHARIFGMYLKDDTTSIYLPPRMWYEIWWWCYIFRLHDIRVCGLSMNTS